MDSYAFLILHPPDIKHPLETMVYYGKFHINSQNSCVFSIIRGMGLAIWHVSGPLVTSSIFVSG